ncbi:MAG: HD domain-containing protein, partial [Proteobacteria bacterium]|nr:HD domain-containing protein [Pseudomonadota bacterium]
MVSVTHAISQGDTAPPIDLLAAGLEPTEREHIEAALEWIADLYEGKVLGTGEPTWTHAIGAALIAASLRLDAETRVAALLFAAWEELEAPAEEIEARFGPAITALVRGLHKL